MVRALVLRAAGVGALAGVVAFVFARIFAEPLIQAAIMPSLVGSEMCIRDRSA